MHLFFVRARHATKLAIDWEADTAIEESVLRSIGNPRLKPIFRGVAEIQRCFVSLPRVSSGRHRRAAWLQSWWCIAGTTSRPTGPNAARFALKSTLARVLLAGSWFTVSEAYVRHATCRWCKMQEFEDATRTRTTSVALTHATTHSFTVSPLRQRRVVMQCLAKAWALTSGRQQQQTPPQQHNTTIPQHHNTNTTTPNNTTTPQHPTSVVLGRCSTCSSIDLSDVAAERLQRHRTSPENGAPKQRLR